MTTKSGAAESELVVVYPSGEATGKAVFPTR
jgi:hypothetical protein